MQGWIVYSSKTVCACAYVRACARTHAHTHTQSVAEKGFLPAHEDGCEFEIDGSSADGVPKLISTNGFLCQKFLCYMLIHVSKSLDQFFSCAFCSGSVVTCQWNLHEVVQPVSIKLVLMVMDWLKSQFATSIPAAKYHHTHKTIHTIPNSGKLHLKTRTIAQSNLATQQNNMIHVLL